MNKPSVLNTVFFTLSIIALLAGFAKFESLEMIDLSTILFAVFLFFHRVKIFFYDRHYFETAAISATQFQQTFFLSLLSWMIWILTSYYIFDNFSRVSFVLMALALIILIVKTILSPVKNTADKAQQYFLAMNVVYVFFLLFLRASKGTMSIFYEWAALIILNAIMVVDYFIGKRLNHA